MPRLASGLVNSMASHRYGVISAQPMASSDSAAVVPSSPPSRVVARDGTPSAYASKLVTATIRAAVTGATRSTELHEELAAAAKARMPTQSMGPGGALSASIASIPYVAPLTRPSSTIAHVTTSIHALARTAVSHRSLPRTRESSSRPLAARPA